MDSRPRLVCIPSNDVAFAKHAAALFEGMATKAAGVIATESFADLLRLSYPTVIVRERHELADLSPHDGPVWYVIRRAFASRISASIEIPADHATVYATYVERMPEWQVAVRLRAKPSGPASAGVEYSAEYDFMGRKLRGRMRIVDASPPWAVRVEAEGMGVNVWYVTTFRPTLTGTRIDVVGDYVLPTRFIPAAVERLVVERRIASDIERSHLALRDVSVRQQALIAADPRAAMALSGAPMLRAASRTP